MKRLAIALLLAGLLAPVVACDIRSSGPTITQDQLSDEIGGGKKILLLDVRSDEEYRTGHIPGAKNVPFNEVGDWLRNQSLPPKTDIVVYCETGSRSGTVQQLLIDKGFTSVRHLEGDMKAWRDCEECAEEK
jgi:rhodanese-related sulfurtransferase